MKNKPLVIGITGAFGSGKSTASNFFNQKGFTKLTLSSFLEEEAKKRGIKKITRRILQDIGNKWRKGQGKGVLAKKAIEFIKKNKINKAVIDGIRNVGEIDMLRENGNLILLSIVADREVRFNRLKVLKRRENLNWELFTKLDRRDLGLGQKESGLHVAECIALADYFIDNNSSIEDFKIKLEAFLKKKIKI